MSEINGLPDPQRSQILRQQCNRIFAGKRVHDIVGALEMLVADTLLCLPGQTEATTESGLNSITADIRNIIRERFAARGKGH